MRTQTTPPTLRLESAASSILVRISGTPSGESWRHGGRGTSVGLPQCPDRADKSHDPTGRVGQQGQRPPIRPAAPAPEASDRAQPPQRADTDRHENERPIEENPVSPVAEPCPQRGQANPRQDEECSLERVEG